jgi:hypothetical protein
MRLLATATLLLVACTSNDPGQAIEVCHFESGRPCPADTVCLGTQGNECNYFACDVDGQLVGTAIGCQAGTVDPVAGAPFNCDPATLSNDAAPGSITPPQGACPLGALYALDPAQPFPFLFCVPVEQCAPIACDPQFDGDGCPSGYGCSAATRTCAAPGML